MRLKGIMENEKRIYSILIAEDDRDYYRIMQESFEAAAIPTRLAWVEDGDVCLNYLLREGKFSTQQETSPPDLILLDLNMPRKNGFDTLTELKKHPTLRAIPVVIMTVSRSQEDIYLSYLLGAASFITKPIGFQPLTEMVKSFHHYWFNTVALARPKKIVN